jgi:aspartate kinase
MKVFKFGGASVKDADGVKNMASIVQYQSGELIIVISAMGKTTNALEKVVKYYFSNQQNELKKELNQIKEYHISLVVELDGNDSSILNEITEVFQSVQNKLFNTPASLDYDFEYDQIVSYGEIISSKIASLYLASIGFQHKWVDIRKCLRTDDTWREGNIDWELSSPLVPEYFNFNVSKAYLTQGFIAATSFNSTTTLGREGSDYSAAILANIMEASK